MDFSISISKGIEWFDSEKTKTIALIEHTEKRPYLIMQSETYTYKYLIGTQSLKDCSVIGNLKTLYSSHKLTKFDYKDSIHRINQNKPLKNRVKSALYFLNLSYKSKRRTTQKKETTENNHRRQYLPISIYGLNYAPIIKRKHFRAYMALIPLSESNGIGKGLSAEYILMRGHKIHRNTIKESKTLMSQSQPQKTYKMRSIIIKNVNKWGGDHKGFMSILRPQKTTNNHQ